MNKIWKIRGFEGKFADEELIKMIKEGRLLASDYISTKDMKNWIKIEDSIYQFYLRMMMYMLHLRIYIPP